jgi:putative PEP-CTERM system TPR-repeat lipoprotein
MNPLRNLLEQEPESDTARILLAECLQDLGQPGNAREHLARVLEQHPESVPAQALMARLEIQAGNLEQAQVYSGHIQQQFPELYLGYELEGDARMAASDPPGALAAYQQARERKPSSELAVKLARAETRAGNPARAAELLEGWLAEHAGDVRVRQFLGETYQEMGQNDKAVQAYEQVLAAEPENEVALNNLAWQYLLADNPAALPLAERAYRVDPANPGVLDTYGWLLVRDGQLARGLALLREAIAQLPGEPEVRYHYAAALYESGDREQGRRLIRELLQEHAAFAGRDAAAALIEK